MSEGTRRQTTRDLIVQLYEQVPIHQDHLVDAVNKPLARYARSHEWFEKQSKGASNERGRELRWMHAQEVLIVAEALEQALSALQTAIQLSVRLTNKTFSLPSALEAKTNYEVAKAQYLNPAPSPRISPPNVRWQQLQRENDKATYKRLINKRASDLGLSGRLI